MGSIWNLQSVPKENKLIQFSFRKPENRKSDTNSLNPKFLKYIVELHQFDKGENLALLKKRNLTQ